MADLPDLQSDQVKKVITESGQKSQFSVAPGYFHTHNSVDSVSVDISDISRFPKAPSAQDILYFDGKVWQNLAAGVSGQVLQTNGTTTTLGWVSSSSVNQLFIADEAISNSAAVAVSLNGVSGINQTTNDANTTVGGGNWVAQTFTTDPTAVAIRSVAVTWSGPNVAGNDRLFCDIYATSGNLPTGSALATFPQFDVAGSPGNTNLVHTFTFANAFSVTANTKYAYVFRETLQNWVMKLQWSNSDTYGGGQAATSANSGVTWSAQSTKDLVLTDNEYQANHIVQAVSDNNDNRLNAFIGFAPSASGSSVVIASGATGSIAVDGIAIGFSKLIPGNTYYLQDSTGTGFGTIGTTAGTFSRKVGLAVGSSTLLIKQDNP